jgi:O-acetylhomoserine/O-acetylserine sulfhydrylase-like pyridoxal-dependent enzyme
MFWLCRVASWKALSLVPERQHGSLLSQVLPELKHARGLEPGGIRLSVGLEDWHDIINDLEIALEQI